jgi:hypothetical protein
MRISYGAWRSCPTHILKGCGGERESRRTEKAGRQQPEDIVTVRKPSSVNTSDDSDAGSAP